MGSERTIEKVSSESGGGPSPRRSRIFFLRNLLVNKPCQFSILLYTLVTMFLTSSIVMTTLLIYLRETDSGSSFRWLLVIGFATFFTLFLYGFWFSNKIVGPIYRLEKHMQSVLRGETVTELRFRSGDHFQTTAGLYNQVLKQIGKIGDGQ